MTLRTKIKLYLGRLWARIRGRIYVESLDVFIAQREWLAKQSVPVDYSRAIKETAAQINNNILHLRDKPQTVEETDQWEAYHRKLVQIRGYVGSVRNEGFGAAKKELPLDVNPHPQGSGPAKQWARGWCMGMNITDIKEIYDAA